MNDPLDLPTPLMQTVESPRACSYLPEETAQLEYRFFASLSPTELEHLVERGWRRFGVGVFRPQCVHCTQCVPVRIDVPRFEPSKSQRKVWKQNQQVDVTLHRPTVTDEHIALYNAWHVDMHERRGWPLQQTNEESYAEGFLSGRFASGWEMQYREQGELIGVGLIDRLPNSLSSAYFFHAPQWRQRGPGTFSLMCEIDVARKLGLAFVYLGYWIERCPSMSYKNRFRPFEVLHDRPLDTIPPRWLPADARES
ncbi:arginyltransferase [Planctomicrobium sp. SH664]|uniref:arginyltransferase n=1 Tax=Planctomicrobium sp. SH664 TaxID=3448125 RepID=UPI003F5BC1B7